jgi:hypothetical protein
MRKMTFISVQPDELFFHWQVEVFIHNAMSKGVNPNWIEILFACDQEPTPESIALATKYPFVRFFFYRKQQIETHGYVQILRPDVLEQHFKRFPNLEHESIFYHDSDIIFRELPNFELLNSDDTWYFSDTISYIGAEYIQSKGEELLPILCSIAGVSEELVIENQENSGGAQYLMKGLTHEFWRDVKLVSLALYKFMSDSEIQERKTLSDEDLKTYNPIQKWCADMWAVFWCGLKQGRKIRISKELDFSWSSTMGHEEWLNSNILHNAGVIGNEDGKYFFKNDYRFKEPWDEDFSNIDTNSNSYNYLQSVLFAKEQRLKY